MKIRNTPVIRQIAGLPPVFTMHFLPQLSSWIGIYTKWSWPKTYCTSAFASSDLLICNSQLCPKGGSVVKLNQPAGQVTAQQSETSETCSWKWVTAMKTGKIFKKEWKVDFEIEEEGSRNTVEVLGHMETLPVLSTGSFQHVPPNTLSKGGEGRAALLP